MINEVFVDICQYEGQYQVSNLGNVKYLSKEVICGRHKNYYRFYEDFILKKFQNKRGYQYVTLTKNGIQKRFLIHRLVANCFLQNDKNLPYVNHINGIKSDNNKSNLEWVTARENDCHRQKTNTNKTSIYIGVNYDKKTRKFRSQISINKKKFHLGYFTNEEEAYKARTEFELKNNIINKYI